MARAGNRGIPVEIKSKTKWSKPKLVIFSRWKPAEAVLDKCKWYN
jgi:hypothetical protein